MAGFGCMNATSAEYERRVAEITGMSKGLALHSVLERPAHPDYIQGSQDLGAAGSRVGSSKR
jgi:hypothetical protein